MRFTTRRIAIALACSGLAGGVAGRATRLIEERRTRPAPSVAVVSAVAPASSAPRRVAKPFEVATTIYDGKLAAGWEDWGRGRHELPKQGPARVVFGGYAGIVFRGRELSGDFGALSFRFKAPRSWAPFLSVTLKHVQQSDDSFGNVTLTLEDVADVGDGWQEAWIAWSRLNPRHLPLDRIVISASRPVGADWVELDKVTLTKRYGPAGAPPLRDATLAIRCNEPSMPISPLIYGISISAWGNGAAAHRIGGNPSSRLNWDLGPVWNAGSDWFFENTSGSGGVDAWINEAVEQRAKSAVTVPMLGWVAKDTTSVGFPSSKFPKQREHDPQRAEAGNGLAPNGTKLRPGSPTETSVPAPPEKIAQWIAALRQKDVLRGGRSIAMYILDNEPSLWSETHRDVHPDPVGQDELLKRTIDYGTAIRRADPETPIAGPAEWGWTGYFFSGKDREIDVKLRPDRVAHGDEPLIVWYLKSLAAHEKSTGVRLLDVLDLHYYPQAPGIHGANARTDAEGAALRLRSTRALWDPKYVDESWIREPVQLIPRMREWVAQNYPGLKTSIGEWSFGADDHMSGALATAEALGRFGTQGLDSAFYWDGPKTTTRAFWAFRAFRDYDGAGGRFQDWSLRTTEAENLSFFASRNETGTRVVAVIVNLDPTFAYRARVDAGVCGAVTGRRAFTYGGSSQGITAEKPVPTTTELVELVPPYSIRVVELTLAKPH